LHDLFAYLLFSGYGERRRDRYPDPAESLPDPAES
jgi:hypothetical protein